MAPNVITKAGVQARVKSVEFTSHGKITTVIVTMVNGFKLTGESASVDEANLDRKLSQEYALGDALKKAIAYEGYLLQERLYLAAPCTKTPASPLAA